MTLPLSEKSIAILAASGFDENHMAAMQRALTRLKVPHKIIATEQGLVNGWQDNNWGHYFTVDQVISQAMGSDYDALILVGGERGVTKLKGNPHTKRIVNHFLEAGKPVAAIGSGVALLGLSPKSAGIEVTASADVAEEVKAAGMILVEDICKADGAVLTGNGSDIDAWVEAALKMVEEVSPFEQEEAA